MGKANCWTKSKSVVLPAHRFAMTDSDRYIRRYVRIVNCGDDTWNGALVQVTFYNEDGTYSVTPSLTKKNQLTPKESQMVLYKPAQFLNRYPNARVVKGSHAMAAIPVGCVVDFSAADPTIRNTSPHLSIDGPCRVIGRPITHPMGATQTINNHLLVKAKPFDLVEFENLVFDGSHASGAWEVDCAAGQIVFRSCTFLNSKRSVQIGFNVSDDLRVSFENCTFRNIPEAAITVQTSCYAHITKCLFENCGMAIVVKEDAYADIVNCNFTKCTGGVLVPAQGEAVINNSQFNDMTDFAVLAAESGMIHSCSCTATNCTTSAVVIEGGGSTHVRVKLWLFKQCLVGIRMGNGTANAQLVGNAFRECKVGTFITLDAAGGALMLDNTDNHCVNLSAEKFDIYRDLRYLVPEVHNLQLVQLHATKAFLAEHGIKYGYPVSPLSKKILAEAGLIEIVCAMCKAVAPTDNVYKKCARCSEARYCSKACQETHWSTHSVACRIHEARAKKMSIRGYVACDKCGKVESHCSGVSHNACGKCLAVFYCNRECQAGDWSVHKKQCKAYQKA